MRLIVVAFACAATSLIVVHTRPALASGPYPGYFEAYPATRSSVSVAWAARAQDVDGDGRDELLTGWYGYDAFGTQRSYVQVRSFGATPWESSRHTEIEVAAVNGDTPDRVAVADLDGDGDLDLAVGLYDTLVFVPAITPGVFGPAIKRPSSSSFLSVAAADFDGDGIVDLAVSHSNESFVEILRGTGGFSYVQTATFHTHRFPGLIDVADLNGDGASDLVVGADTSSSVLLGDGAGQFTYLEVAAQHAAVAGDLNGDGVVDILTRAATYLGNGDGTFQPGLPFPALNAVVTADMDEDGRLDLVGIKSASPAFLMSVQRGLGDGTFGPPTLQPYSRGGTNTLVAGDFDGDGHQDIAQPGRFGTDGVMYGLGNGLFQGPRVVPCGLTVKYLKAGEFGSHTGKDLLVVSKAANSMGILHRTGLAQWSLPDTVALPAIPAAWGPEVADLNGDGRDDVVLAYDDLPVVSYWLTDATGHLGPRVDLPEPNAVYSKTIEIAVGDVDGDGDADILYQPTFDGGVQYDGIPLGWYQGAGDGTFTFHGTLPYLALGNLEIGDLSGDGIPDLAMMNRNYGIRVVVASAPGVFGPYTDLAPLDIPYFAQHFVVGRLDADAAPDLVLFNGASWLFRGNGNGVFAGPVGLPADAAFGTSAYTRDLDGDGRDEIVSGTNYVRLKPDGSLDGAVGFGVAAGNGSGISVTLDADDNGSPDLVSSGSNELQLKVLLNKSGTQVLRVVPPATPVPSIRLTALQNPSRREITVRLSTAFAGPVTLEVFDLQGRRVGGATTSPTVKTVTLPHAGALAPGVYLVVARQAERSARTRVALLR